MSGHKNRGFTIVELLIVIVVIAILAVIGVVAYNGVQERARNSKIQADLSTLDKAIRAARAAESKTLLQITGVSYTASGCSTQPAGTDLAALPKTDGCWTRYQTTLNRISTASGMDVTQLVDPWGRPYHIDENEGEGGSCTYGRDLLAVYAIPLNGGAATNVVWVPYSEFSSCA